MGRDASLDEFLTGEGDPDGSGEHGPDSSGENGPDGADENGPDGHAEDPADGDGDADGSGDDRPAEPGGAAGDDPGEGAGVSTDPALEPATPTYDWSPGGAKCSGCGGTVGPRWRDDDGLVCEECKDW